MTSIEWLEKEIWRRGPIGEDTPTWLKELYEQAKEMHKQEIIYAYRVGACEVDKIVVNKPEQYYQETFNNKQLNNGETN
jgi:hypothetical protein